MPLGLRTPAIIFIGADFVIQIRDDGLRDVVTGEAVNTASCVAVLKELDGTLLGMATLDYVEETDGFYAGSIPASVTSNLEECSEYLLNVSATAGPVTDLFSTRVIARYQGRTG